jgi:hypothetical protein
MDALLALKSSALQTLEKKTAGVLKTSPALSERTLFVESFSTRDPCVFHLAKTCWPYRWPLCGKQNNGHSKNLTIRKNVETVCGHGMIRKTDSAGGNAVAPRWGDASFAMGGSVWYPVLTSSSHFEKHHPLVPPGPPPY